MPTLTERVAVLEANNEWIKESLEDLHSKMDTHVAATPAANGGIVISINKKTLGLLSLVPITGGAAGIYSFMERIGILVSS